MSLQAKFERPIGSNLKRFATGSTHPSCIIHTPSKETIKHADEGGYKSLCSGRGNDPK